jgi:hypothetical protein
MGLAEKWHVVEPRRGELIDIVWIQNKEERLDVRFGLSPAQCDDLTDDEKEQRIRDAIAKARAK